MSQTKTAGSVELEMPEKVCRREDEEPLKALLDECTRELEAATRQMAYISEGFWDGFYALDAGLRILYMNKGAEEVLGLPLGDAVGRGFADLIPKANGITLVKMRGVLQDGQPRRFEVFSRVVNHWVEARLYPSQDGVLAYFRDITARKQTEAALSQSEELFAKVFQYYPDMIGIRRMADGYYVDVNPMFLATLGYTREEVVGRQRVGIWADSEQAQADLLARLCKQGELGPHECRLRTKSGRIVTAVSSVVLLDVNGELCRIVILKDVTALKRYEKEVARLDRLNLIGEMAASITHEIRNPLTTIRGFLQLMSEKDKSGGNWGYYEVMIEELDRANTIISDYLSLVRNQKTKRQPGYLNSIVRAIYPLVLADANLRGLQVRLDLGAPPQLDMDEKEIRQMILNLTRNGLDAMSPGGTLTVGTGVDGPGAVLSVRDEGPGLDPAVVDRLGTPFLTTKKDGTGLGLAICYSIAARHNARIDVDTGPDGTTFTVRFGKGEVAKTGVCT